MSDKALGTRTLGAGLAEMVFACLSASPVDSPSPMFVHPHVALCRELQGEGRAQLRSHTARDLAVA